MSTIWTIRRSPTDTKVSGLCGGVAEHYLAGWLLVPVAGKERSVVDDLFGAGVARWPRELWITLVVLACIAAFAVFGALTPFSIGPAVVIAIIWYFGFYRPRQRTGSSGTSVSAPPAVAPPVATQPYRYPGPPTPFTQAAEAWARRVEEHTREASGVPATGSPVRSAAPPPSSPPPLWPSPPPPGSRSTVTEPGSVEPGLAEPSERDQFLATPDPVGLYAEPVRAVVSPVPAADRSSARRLRLLTLVVAGLALGGLGVLDVTGTSVPLSVYLATALLVVGLALVAATWWGRARGLLPLGLVLAVAVLASSTVGDSMLRMPVMGTTTRAYASVASLPSGGDAIDVGNLTVDLQQLVVDRDVTYRAQIDVGNLEVSVPPNTRVVVRYRNDVGAVNAFGTQLQAGTDLHGESADPSSASPGQPTLTLDLSVDVGNVSVRR